MCRSIKKLSNFEPPATSEEIHEAALQFVRKISGLTKPSKANEAVFEATVENISGDLHILLSTLYTSANPKTRELAKE